MEPGRNYLRTTYLFFLTFFAFVAIFPVGADYVIQTYQLFDIGFLTPPSEISGWLIYGGITVFTVAALVLASKYKSTEKLEYFSVTALRYVLAFTMIIVYGYCKIVSKQFQLRYSAMDMPLKDVNDFDLVWYFYGRSNIQTFLLGMLEFIPGLLLLFRRTSFLGAVVLLPVLANVMLLDNFNDVGPHLNIFSTLLFVFDVGILLFYRKEIRNLFRTAAAKLARPDIGKFKTVGFNVIKILFVVLIVFRFGKGFYTAAKTGTERSKSQSKCFGTFELSSVSYNQINYPLDSLSDYWKRLYFEKIDDRNTRLLNKHNQIVEMACMFHEDKDSISIYSYDGLDENDEPIGLVVFDGTYTISGNDSILTLSGIRNDTAMTAVYRKLPINGHNWWW